MRDSRGNSKSMEVESFDTIDSYFGKKMDFDRELLEFLARRFLRTGQEVVKIQRYITGPETAVKNQTTHYIHRRVKVMFSDGSVKRFWFRPAPRSRSGWQIYKSGVESRW